MKFHFSSNSLHEPPSDSSGGGGGSVDLIWSRINSPDLYSLVCGYVVAHVLVWLLESPNVGLAIVLVALLKFQAAARAHLFIYLFI